MLPSAACTVDFSGCFTFNTLQLKCTSPGSASSLISDLLKYDMIMDIQGISFFKKIIQNQLVVDECILPSCWQITMSAVGSIIAWLEAGAPLELLQMKSSIFQENCSGESLMLCHRRSVSSLGLLFREHGMKTWWITWLI